MDYAEAALKMHRENHGKLEMASKIPLTTRDELSTAYTPGVAAPCLKIKEDKSEAYTYTAKGNLVAVVTDGTAVLGLGDIGPEAAMPVMEGKAVLFKKFGGVDALAAIRSQIVSALPPGNRTCYWFQGRHSSG